MHPRSSARVNHVTLCLVRLAAGSLHATKGCIRGSAALGAVTVPIGLRRLAVFRCSGQRTSCLQANTRVAAGSGTGSLLRQWITKVIAGYASKVTWPLQSLKLDDQLAFAKVGASTDPDSSVFVVAALAWTLMAAQAQSKQLLFGAATGAHIFSSCTSPNFSMLPCHWGFAYSKTCTCVALWSAADTDPDPEPDRLRTPCCCRSASSGTPARPSTRSTFDDVTRSISGLTVSSTTGNCDAGLMINANQVSGANANPRVSWSSNFDLDHFNLSNTCSSQLTAMGSYAACCLHFLPSPVKPGLEL